MYRVIAACFYTVFLCYFTSCCKDENKSEDGVIWKNRISGKGSIGARGLGYPIYNNTVVFHSTPNIDDESIIHGLDIETGKEKWRLTAADFFPKKSLVLYNTFGTYQKDNIVVASDEIYKPLNTDVERYIYGIDIDKGKVLWVTQLPADYYSLGAMIKGAGQYAYVDATSDNKISLLRVDIATGALSSAIDVFNNVDLPPEVSSLNAYFSGFYFSEIYKNSNGDDMVALSLMPDLYDKPNITVLYVYNLTKKAKVYTTTVTFDGSNAWIYHLNGKIIIGTQKTAFCYDAFENKKYWEKSVVLNDGVGSGSGNDEILQVLGYDNLALVYCVDRLVAFDINTGAVKYNVPSSHTAANIIDGVIYQREGSDLQMRDPRTGRELKRIVTGINEQAFSSSRPNGKDGKIFIHSYTDAYCIKAWGR
jgi:outer membrane protein assembly factor BamB